VSEEALSPRSGATTVEPVPAVLPAGGSAGAVGATTAIGSESESPRPGSKRGGVFGSLRKALGGGASK
jgi:hypothetical protein